MESKMVDMRCVLEKHQAGKDGRLNWIVIMKRQHQRRGVFRVRGKIQV